MFRRLVFLCLCVCTHTGEWGHVRLGKPLLELRDYVLTQQMEVERGAFQLPAVGTPRPASFSAVELVMSQAVAANGLRLVHETRADGNCGPDA